MMAKTSMKSRMRLAMARKDAADASSTSVILRKLCSSNTSSMIQAFQAFYQALHNQHSFDELGNLPGFAQAPQILHPRKLTRFCRSVHLWEHVSRCILSREDNTSAAVSACVITLFMPAYYAEKKGQGRAQAIWHHSCCLYPHESSPARLNTRSQVVA